MTSDDWRTSGHRAEGMEAPAPHGASPQDAQPGTSRSYPPLPPGMGPQAHAISGWWRDFVRAAAFLTRIPLQIDSTEANRPLASAVRGFPIVGLVVGVTGALVLVIANAVGLPQLASSLLAIASTALITGGLHEEGLANTMDGLFTGTRPDNRLHVIREAQLGTFGMLALMFVVGLKVAALETIEPGSAAASLIAAEVAGRSALPAMLFTIPPARSDGVSFQAGKPQRDQVGLAILLGSALVLLMLGIGSAIIAILVAAAVGMLIARTAKARGGGHTGDMLGAMEEIVSTAVLLVAAAMA